MAKTSTGKYAQAISDRSGMAFPYNEMVTEWNGSFVHNSEFEEKQPQLEPNAYSGDGIALPGQVRSARTEPATLVLLQENPFTTYAAGSGVINISYPGHGLTNSTTYRFRGAPTTISTRFANPSDFDGITGVNIAKAAGYTITTGKFVSGARVATAYVLANNFYFTVDTDTATTGDVKGGGFGCSVGPVTLEA
jgi:hypothetical protein|tara:strand:- start:138 stop:716 length:579 start_codon:yes stop_codon:yes gene_type:complete